MSDSDNLKDAPIDKLLRYDNSDPGEANRFKLIMLHRTIEAMNGLSNRLDQIVEQAKKSDEAQSRQQSAMTWLTRALVGCTLAYTIIAGWSAWEAHEANAIQRANARTQVVIPKA